MIKKEMEPFRHQLLKLAREMQGEVHTLAEQAFHNTDGKAVGNLSDIPVENRGELGSDEYSEDVTIGLLETSNARLGDINAALERIDTGAFGVCDECGQDISNSRLRTVPFARHCIECARKAQRGEPASPGNL
jgi:DnaK suppressor protein